MVSVFYDNCKFLSGRSTIVLSFSKKTSSSREKRKEAFENLSDFITTFNNKNEAMVKVVFGDVEGDKELSVARRIKKTNQGFASTYYLNDKIDTLGKFTFR